MKTAVIAIRSGRKGYQLKLSFEKAEAFHREPLAFGMPEQHQILLYGPDGHAILDCECQSDADEIHAKIKKESVLAFSVRRPILAITLVFNQKGFPQCQPRRVLYQRGEAALTGAESMVTHGHPGLRIRKPVPAIAILGLGNHPERSISTVPFSKIRITQLNGNRIKVGFQSPVYPEGELSYLYLGLNDNRVAGRLHDMILRKEVHCLEPNESVQTMVIDRDLHNQVVIYGMAGFTRAERMNLVRAGLKRGKTDRYGDPHWILPRRFHEVTGITW